MSSEFKMEDGPFLDHIAPADPLALTEESLGRFDELVEEERRPVAGFFGASAARSASEPQSALRKSRLMDRIAYWRSAGAEEALIAEIVNSFADLTRDNIFNRDCTRNMKELTDMLSQLPIAETYMDEMGYLLFGIPPDEPIAPNSASEQQLAGLYRGIRESQRMADDD